MDTALIKGKSKVVIKLRYTTNRPGTETWFIPSEVLGLRSTVLYGTFYIEDYEELVKKPTVINIHYWSPLRVSAYIPKQDKIFHTFIDHFTPSERWFQVRKFCLDHREALCGKDSIWEGKITKVERPSLKAVLLTSDQELLL